MGEAGGLDATRALILALLVAAVGLALLSRVRLSIVMALAAAPGPILVHARLQLRMLGFGRAAAVTLTRQETKERLIELLARLGAAKDDLDESPLAAPLQASELLRAVRSELRRLSRSRGFDQLELILTLGTGDAAATALACGAASTALGTIAAVALGDALPSRIRVTCVPDWRAQPTWGLNLRCILRPTLSQAIVAAWRAYVLFRLARDGRRKEQEHGRTPHSRADEDRHVDHQGDG